MARHSRQSPQAPAGLQQDYQQRLLRFVCDAVHDLVGPVDQISSLVGLFVRRYRGQLDGEAQDLLTHIESAGARLSATASGLRGYFNVNGPECRRIRVNSRAALESALLALQPESQECQAEISFGDLPDVEGDPNLLEALFRALVQNSLKFRRTGVPPLVFISAECSSGRCLFSIIDNGIGIAPRFHEEVFLGFRKLNGHSYPGAGLGLAMARAIAETLGGKIRIADSGGPGTTVLFELPAAP